MQVASGLLARTERRDAARRLAEHVGADAFLVLVPDHEIGLLRPAAGFPQTLPGGPTWYDFLARCAKTGNVECVVAFPDLQSLATVRACVTEAGAVIAFIGGDPRIGPSELASMCPFLAPLLIAENEIVAASGTVKAAQEASRHAAALAEALDRTRREVAVKALALKNALAEAARLNAELRELNGTLEQKVSQEIQERLKAEESLRQAQKMQAVGRLTGGVAHDFNNLLQVIGGNLQLLSKDLIGNARAEKRLAHALSGVSRGSKLASQLLAFGRRQPLEPKVINLGRLIRDIDDMLRRALGEAIEIETVIAGGLWNSFIDPAQVENALLNLAINARDAMEGRGKLTVEAGNSSLDDEYASRHAEVSPGQYVMLAVTDTGCGMLPEVIEQVFEPFFTTKSEGRGTGLGLSQVYGFVKQSGGHIKVYSEPGHGTTIRIYLPRSRQMEDVATETETAPASGGTETILVVEDDQDVRAVVVETLSDLGYQVLKAKDADSALAMLESGVRIDLLFTDVVMPGSLRSPELARKARERLPDIAVLFTSGYTENAIVHGGRLDDNVELLSKPYTREALARKLRQILRNQQHRNASEPDILFSLPQEVGNISRSDSSPPLRVLLVEDDALIRLSTADMLESLGYSVVEASTALDALAVLDDQPVDVLVTDIGLPGMSGGQLAEQACLKMPGLQVVFASGQDHIPGLNGAITSAVQLRKPYDQAALADALTKAVGGILGSREP